MSNIINLDVSKLLDYDISLDQYWILYNLYKGNENSALQYLEAFNVDLTTLYSNSIIFESRVTKIGFVVGTWFTQHLINSDVYLKFYYTYPQKNASGVRLRMSKEKLKLKYKKLTDNQIATHSLIMKGLEKYLQTVTDERFFVKMEKFLDDRMWEVYLEEEEDTSSDFIGGIVGSNNPEQKLF